MICIVDQWVSVKVVQKREGNFKWSLRILTIGLLNRRHYRQCLINDPGNPTSDGEAAEQTKNVTLQTASEWFHHLGPI